MYIGEKIRNAREDMDLSQNDMEKLIPMNQSNYSKIERNIQEPSLYQFKRICEVLRLDPRDLLGMSTDDVISDMDKRLLKDFKNLLDNYKT